ncbi:MAG: hypothetical protein ACREJU_07010 [Nitrospiraceae bacterium]
MWWSLAGQLLGCSSKGPQYPEDHARYRRIDAAMEELRQAYVRKDLSALQSVMLPVDSLERMQLDIKRDFDEFQEIVLDFAIDRIVIEGETIDVYVHWQGQWTRASADTVVRDRGHGMLRWVGVQSILLNGIDGDLPFGMATRHTVPPPPST